MDYCILKNILKVDDQEICFDNDIMQAIEVDKVVIVVLDINSGEKLIDNVYGVLDGKVIWKIQSYLELDSSFEQTSYVLAKIINEKEIVVTDFCGCRFIVQASSGKILERMSSMK